MIRAKLAVVVLCISCLTPVLLKDVQSDEIDNKINSSRRSLGFNNLQLLPSESERIRIVDTEVSTSVDPKIKINPLSTENCPSTDILLMILNLFTKLVPTDDLELQQFKEAVSTIKLILENSSVDKEQYNLFNNVDLLKDQLDKINDVVKIQSELRDQNQKGKITVQYDVPNKCEEVLYTLIKFINDAYNRATRYCLLTGKCNLSDLPQVRFDSISSRQIKPSLALDQVLKQLLLKESLYYPNSNGLISSYENSINKHVFDDIAEDKIYETHSGSKLINQDKTPLNLLISQQHNVDYNNLISNLKNNIDVNLYKQTNGPNVWRKQPYLNWLLQTSSSSSSLPVRDQVSVWQGMLSALSKDSSYSKVNQEYLNILNKNLNLYSHKGEENINTNLLNILKPQLGTTTRDIIQSSKIIQLPSNLEISSSRIQPIVKEKELLIDSVYSPYNQILSNQEILNKVKTNEWASKLQQLQQPKAQNIASYVTSDLLIAPDKDLQRIQLPDLSQLSIANADKLNTRKENEVVELTYMLKHSKPDYMPLYYVKFRMPYGIFLYHLQDLLLKNPLLKYQPNELYRALSIRSKISDLSDDLKTLTQEDLLKLISSKGTLVTTKIVEENRDLNIKDVAREPSVSILEKLVKATVNPKPTINLASYAQYPTEIKRDMIVETSLNPNTLKPMVYPNVSGQTTSYSYRTKEESPLIMKKSL